MSDDGNTSCETYPRSMLYRTQTPQGFYIKDIWQLHQEAIACGNTNSISSCTLMVELGKKVHFIMGSEKNLKLTTIDDLDILISRSSLEQVHYTKMKREDTYESIRQLIDDIDSLRYIMFTFAFERSLMDDENAGLKSYQALWMRIQSEISGESFNRFADIVDMDSMAAQEYTPAVLANISKEISDTINNQNVSGITLEQATSLLEQAKYGNVGIPQLIYNVMMGGAKDETNL